MDSLSLQKNTSVTKTTNEQIALERAVRERKVGERTVGERKVREGKVEELGIKHAVTEGVKPTEGTSSKFNVFITTCRKLPNVFKPSKTNISKDSAKKIINIKSIRKSFSRLFRSNKIAPI